MLLYSLLAAWHSCKSREGRIIHTSNIEQNKTLEIKQNTELDRDALVCTSVKIGGITVFCFLNCYTPLILASHFATCYSMIRQNNVEFIMSAKSCYKLRKNL
uniref:Uncharacterized protein n=1 Tax=Glossina pallidipes TaxID=7398 RepID=A0A1B0A2G1_GLOPL